MAVALLVVLAAASVVTEGTSEAGDLIGGVVLTSVDESGPKPRLICTLNSSMTAVEGHRWVRGDKVLQEDTLPSLRTEYLVSADDSGAKYTCIFLPEPSGRAVIPVKGPPRVMALKKSDQANEGESITLKCKSDSFPPISQWIWFKKRDGEDQVILNDSSSRFTLHSGPSHTELRIEHLDMQADPGMYVCNGTNAEGSASAMVTLRVRSRLAALWPFLGIVAEVLVLVTIIFIYEKRRKPDDILDDDDLGSAPLKSPGPAVNDNDKQIRQRNAN